MNGMEDRTEETAASLSGKITKAGGVRRRGRLPNAIIGLRRGSP